MSGELGVEEENEGEGDGVVPKEESEELANKYEKLKIQVEDHFDQEHAQEKHEVPIIKTPSKPTKQEWERHQATHTPFEPWCKHCLAARAVRSHHPSKGRKALFAPDVEKGVDGPIKISIDYMYLHELLGKLQMEEHNPPQLVMINHNNGRVWAYRVPNNGVMDGAAWLPKRMLQDISNCGHEGRRIQLKSDQEPSIVALQGAIQDIRPDVVPTNSPVGESESNGRAENAIRRVQEKIRVLRHKLEQGIKQTVPDDSPIMAWLVRWSAELISKYSQGSDGRTAYERIRHERCKTPVVPFGEVVMYLPLRTATHSKGQPARKLGLWLGTIERIEETIIGTMTGVVKCRTIRRLAEDDKWNPELVLKMQGLPWPPVPNKSGQHIPVEINSRGEAVDEAEENEEPPKESAAMDEEELEYQRKVHSLHVSRKAVSKYGTAEGCPACNVIDKRGHLQGKLGYNHNTTCRARILEAMREDPEYRKPLYKHQPHQEAGDIEILTDEQVMEKRNNVTKAIQHIERGYTCNRANLEQQLTSTMIKNLLAKIDVAEVHSPPRATTMAERMGLRAGWALDFTTCDEDGRPWNFDQLEMRNRAVHKLLKDEPTLLIGSPMCTAFSQINQINHPKMDPWEVERRMSHGRKHLEFCTKLYELQWKVGRYFLHEHPAEASSWKEGCIKRLLEKHGVMKVNGDQCRYGFTSTKSGRSGPARKATGFLTNAPCIAKQLSKQCPNRQGWMVHQHVRLEGGRTRLAQVYPPELCRAICRGLELQLQADREGQFLLASVEPIMMTKSGDLLNAANELMKKYKIVEEDLDDQREEAWDDVSGAQLDANEVRRARMEEIEYIHKMQLYTKVPVAECYQRTNKSPISVRWVDTNKGDTERPNYRSRFVAREINTYKRNDLFAATPPLEAMKLILSTAALGNKGEVLMVNDVSRAFFHAKATREVYVQLPEEDSNSSGEKLCGRLNFSMYGTRDTAMNCQAEYSQMLIDNGFKQGASTPCRFYHEEKVIRTLVHGDDYLSVGKPNSLKWMEAVLMKKYQIKTQVLGPDEDQVQQVKVLNRIIECNGAKGIMYEADPRHAEIIVEQLRLIDAKPLTIPGTKEEGTTQENSSEKLDSENASLYRALVARCNYLSPDRSDIAYIVKELARHMSDPSKGNWQQLKRFGRYLKGKPRIQQTFKWQKMPDGVEDI